jgi:hypothetical protein
MLPASDLLSLLTKIEQLEAEVGAAIKASMLATCDKEIFKHQLAEREATIQKMRDVIEYMASLYTDGHDPIIQSVMPIPPTEHLSQYRDAVIEECANQAFDFWCSQYDSTQESAAKAIRAMKGQK